MKPPTQAEINRALYGYRQKYGNKRTNGYASMKEAERAGVLKLLEKCGAISDLKEQVKFELLPADGKLRPITYVSDFSYFELNDSSKTWVVEDVKGMRTAVYKLKKRMMWHLRGIRIREI